MTFFFFIFPFSFRGLVFRAWEPTSRGLGVAGGTELFRLLFSTTPAIPQRLRKILSLPTIRRVAQSILVGNQDLTEDFCQKRMMFVCACVVDFERDLKLFFFFFFVFAKKTSYREDVKRI